MAEKQNIDIPLIATAGLVGFMLLAIVVWGVQAWYGYETDRINSVRYAADRNTDWLALRNEQYANIGDPIGNATIYAAASPVEDEATARTFGYRWTSQDKSTAAIPIHAAMAEVVKQYGQGGQNVTAEVIQAADREPVKQTDRNEKLIRYGL